MKKILLILFYISILCGFAQNYGNEWIDYTKTYYKFKIVKKGFYRIPQQTLVNAGISANTLVGSSFKLFRNGVEVPIYVTSNAIFTSNDYIEFLGIPNDGKFDTQLYKNPTFQPHNVKSLFQDSATYFLSISPNTTNLRITNRQNNITGTLSKELYCYRTLTRYSIANFNGVPSMPAITAYNSIFNSDFDNGEGYGGNVPSGISHNGNSDLYTSDNTLSAKLSVHYFAQKLNDHNALLKVNNVNIYNDIFYGIGMRKINVTLPISQIGINTAITLTPQTSGEGAYQTRFSELTFPSKFDARSKNSYEFSLDKSSAVYIEIPNFVTNNTQPILYDITNNNRFILDNSSLLRIQMPATSLNKSDIYISSSDSILIINRLEQINFINYSSTSLQGDFLIITNSLFTNVPSTENYVEVYKQYRNSIQGGSYISQIYDIDQLNDQFAYGIEHHPLAIRNFINYAIDVFFIKPKLLFIIGEGREYTTLRNKNNTFIQTYGLPASDNLLVARSAIQNAPQLGVGRLSVNNNIQILDYLNKVKEYEASLYDTFPSAQSIANKLWRKNVIHLSGGRTQFEQASFSNYLLNYENIIEGAKYGGNVYNLYKTSSSPIQIAESRYLDSLINNGVSLITFFGHSSTNELDFNLVPEHFTNKSKYHLMFTNGCFVGNIFSNGLGYSERFVLTPDKAAIGFLGPMTLGVPTALNYYSTQFYNNLGINYYNEPIGYTLKASAASLINNPPTSLDPQMAEQMIFHGDPALRINTFPKPDYYIDESSISFNPSQPSTIDDSFAVNIVIRNLGAALPNCFFNLTINRTLPNGTFESYQQRVPCVNYIDTITIYIHNNNAISGLNTFTIKVDYDNEVDETSESNNEVTLQKNITSDDILPIFPYEFCIVNNPIFKLIFNTANTFATNKQYILQIDTTEHFNSPHLFTQVVNSPGSVIEWQPTYTFDENRVYYWRGSLDTIYDNELRWRTSSFLFNTSLSTGWNQSHYFQYIKDNFNFLELSESSRIFNYPNSIRNLEIRNGQRSFVSDQFIETFLDGFSIGKNSCEDRSFLFFVFDPNTGLFRETTQIGRTGRGSFGDRQCVSFTKSIIEFPTGNTTTGFEYRQRCFDFLNSIPNGAYVLGYSFFDARYDLWDGDVSLGGNNLYDAFLSLGVSEIRNQTNGIPFVFFLQKGNPNQPVIQITRPGIEGVIDTTFTLIGNWNNGTMQSTVIGPAKEWSSLVFDSYSLEFPTIDFSKVSIYGIDTNGIRTNLFLSVSNPTTDLSSINAEQYPYLQLVWETYDVAKSTPPQLRYWRVIYTKIPEGVINPNIAYTISADSITSGELVSATVAFQNITPMDMDSILVKYTITNQANQSIIYYKRFPPLPGNQHLLIDFAYTFVGTFFSGLNSIIIEVNPNNDQLEQFHYNNFATFWVYVNGDAINPILDVTFDGRHITDGECISSKPEIVIKLKDESKELALDDTSGIVLYMYYPNDPNTPVEINKSIPEITFIPASTSTLSTNNEARLIYKPTLVDGIYELRTQGIDKSNNDAGAYDYRIKFKVDSKPSITNFLNYPNPFSTHTRFVFTLTGSEIPNNLTIQIFSVSGKMVKEISREELGNIHIGTNITEYQWNGTDTYGDKLANGVYFYRVLVKDNNGNKLDLKESGADKFITNGYGKLYIAR